ncbi:MAG: FecR domain-containing protein, partial [Candidatus Rokuibacteriota bacterium]
MTRWTAAAVLAVMLVAAHRPVPAAAQTSDAVGVVTTLDGRATVARPALTSPLALKFKDDVFGRDRISTQENSLIRVLLGGKAILTVRELSQVTISEEPGRAVVTLPSGKVVLAVAKQRMRPGESVEIRTPNAVAAVRGSILAVAYDAVQNVTTTICHSGDCTYQYAGGATNPLPPGQGAKNGQVGPVTQAERNAAVNVEPNTHVFSGPDEGFQTSLFQGQADQAIQVAEFVSTGTVSGLPSTPNLNPSPWAPLNGLTSHPEISSGSTGGGNGSGGNGSGGNGSGGNGSGGNGSGGNGSGG